MKHHLFNYRVSEVPQSVFQPAKVEEISLTVLKYLAANDVRSIADMPALPLVLTREVRDLLPKELAQLWAISRSKGHTFYKLLSVHDDIYKVKMTDDYEAYTVKPVW